MAQVRAVYDFDAQPGSGELSIREGEILTIVREGIEGGWIEGQNAKGKKGLFPEAYVAKIPISGPLSSSYHHQHPASSNPPPSVAPPPLPLAAMQSFSGGGGGRPAYETPPLSSSAPKLSKSNLESSTSVQSWQPPAVDDPWSAPEPVAAPPYVPPGSGQHTHAKKQLSNQESAGAASSLPQLSQPATYGDDDFDEDGWSDDEDEMPSGDSEVAESRRVRSQSRTTVNVEQQSGDNVAPPNDQDVEGDQHRSGDETPSAGGRLHSPMSSSETEGGHQHRAEEKKDFDPHAPVSQRSRSAGMDTVSTTTSGRQFASGAAKMKTINRFSNFVKSGLESYILASSRMTTQPGESHRIVFTNNQIEWEPQGQSYTCLVSKPKKESKLKGLKSFIAYSLTSSLSGIQVSRRYKHFDWLHEQLSAKYMLISIPPLPEKQVSGRYEEDLIEHRKSILQLWVNKICRHPVLSQSEVWTHFIGCTDEKKWKMGKRQAEKDEYVGGNFFNCVTIPPQALDSIKIEKQVDNYSRCVKMLDDNVKEMHERVTDTQKRLIGPYKSHWYKMSQSFATLGHAFDVDQMNPNNPVGSALKRSADVMKNIGDEHDQHGKHDIEPLLDFLYTYRGTFANVPDIANVHRSALSKMRDNERLLADGRISPHDAESIRQRVDVISYAMVAEISHQNHERDNDFRHAFASFFNAQAKFYSDIGKQMADLAQTFSDS